MAAIDIVKRHGEDRKRNWSLGSAVYKLEFQLEGSLVKSPYLTCPFFSIGTVEFCSISLPCPTRPAIPRLLTCVTFVQSAVQPAQIFGNTIDGLSIKGSDILPMNHLWISKIRTHASQIVVLNLTSIEAQLKTLGAELRLGVSASHALTSGRPIDASKREIPIRT
jgi:hypothetical protein